MNEKKLHCIKKICVCLFIRPLSWYKILYIWTSFVIPSWINPPVSELEQFVSPFSNPLSFKNFAKLVFYEIKKINYFNRRTRTRNKTSNKLNSNLRFCAPVVCISKKLFKQIFGYLLSSNLLILKTTLYISWRNFRCVKYGQALSRRNTIPFLNFLFFYI